MKVAILELDGVALAWAVAQKAGVEVEVWKPLDGSGPLLLLKGGVENLYDPLNNAYQLMDLINQFHPNIMWKEATASTGLRPATPEMWSCGFYPEVMYTSIYLGVAVCRAIVRPSGNEYENLFTNVPDELVGVPT